MIVAEQKLAQLINKLEKIKSKIKGDAAIKIITLLQKMCSANLYIETSIKDVINEYSFLKGHIIECGSISKTITQKQTALYSEKLELAFDLINQVINEFGYILKRPELKHITSHCNSSVALALSFIDRWSDDQERTHGNTCNFGLYIINSSDNKGEVFPPTFGMATLELLKKELDTLEKFESLDLHKHLCNLKSSS